MPFNVWGTFNKWLSKKTEDFSGEVRVDASVSGNFYNGNAPPYIVTVVGTVKTATIQGRIK